MQMRSRDFFNFGTIPLFFEQISLYLLAFIVPKDKFLWTFGCNRGYGDGPARMAEYLVRHHPEIQPVWLLSKGQVKPNNKNGILYLEYKSFSWYKACLRASVSVFSTGVLEIGGLACHRAYVVNLWHGVPLKKIGIDRWHRSRIDFIDRTVKRYIGSMISLLPVSSVIHQKRMMSAFGLKKEKVPILGEIRNEALFSLDEIDRLRKRGRSQLSIGCEQISILWAPTWRPERPGIPDFTQRELESIEKILAEHNALLFVRPHPNKRETASPTDSICGERIRLMSAKEYPIVNDYLPVFDALITDYSSISIDFCVLGRPILFFSPDISLYGSQWGLYETFDEFSGGEYVQGIPGFISSLQGMLTDTERYRITSHKLLDRYHDTFRDDSSSKRVVDAVLSRV